MTGMMQLGLLAIWCSMNLIAADWPQFRGPQRDGISMERGLKQSWPEAGPSMVWKASDIGRGYSSPIVVSNRVYITGDVGGEVHIFALDQSGKAIWTATNGLAWSNEYPGARSSVTFNEGRLYHENAHGLLTCLEAATGRKLWSVDLLKNYQGKNITWGVSECALVDERAIYVTAGGEKTSVVAFDKVLGPEKVLWQSERVGENSPSYVSPVLTTVKDRRYVIGCTLRDLFCVDAETGKVVATRPFPTSYSVLAMMPTIVNDAVFMTAPHGKGGFLLKIPNLEEVWHTNLDTCQGGTVFAEGKIFGAFYQPRKGWVAIDASSGKTLYQQPEFVKGSAAFADGRLYALSEDGWIRLLEPTESEFKAHGKFRFAEAHRSDAWAHPVISGAKLYLRYHENLFCYNLKP